MALPGIGRSTAAAIMVFGFGDRHAILDGTVKRVLARVCAIEGYPGSKKVADRLWEQAERFLPQRDVEAYTQGLMDLGATTCLARVPRCGACPLEEGCPSRGMREEPTRKQNRFEGSFRQQRARVLRLVGEASRPATALDAEVVRALERDGLVVVVDGLVGLPG